MHVKSCIIFMKKQDKYILIVSIEEDQSTSDVIDWLIRRKQQFIRINTSKEVSLKSIEILNKKTSYSFEYNNLCISESNIKCLWYRKGLIKIKSQKLNEALLKFDWYFNGEKDSLKSFLLNELDKLSPINKFSNSNINKLIQLTVASSCDLKIPDTIVTNEKPLIDFFIQNQSIVTKSIQIPFVFADNKNIYSLLTNEFSQNDLAKANSKFFHTLFQNTIVKEYELRIFYLDKTFYSMAIFSQRNTKTKIDFRNYDFNTPNRCIPFTLPNEIKNKLQKFMRKLNLTSGSIDMLVDKNNNYYFLEVNPVGQFGMVSIPCNYFLEKKIADYLQKQKK